MDTPAATPAPVLADHTPASDAPPEDRGLCSRTAIIGTLILLAIALPTRLYRLGALDAWGDEIYSYIASTELTGKLLMWETRENQMHSPLTFLDEKIGRRIAGNTELGIRLIPALYSAATTIAIYLVLGRFHSWRLGFFSALLFIFNPYALDWGRDGRMYSHMLFFTVLLVGTAVAAVRHARGENGSWLDWRFWTIGVLFNFAYSSSTFGVMSGVAVGLWLGFVALCDLARGKRGAIHLLAGAALATFVFITSWSLTGIGKIIVFQSGVWRTAPTKGAVPTLADGIVLAAREMTGWVTLPAALWQIDAAGAGSTHVGITCAALAVLVVTVGFVMLGRRGALIGTLIVFVGLVPWIVFPKVQGHPFATRYVFQSLLIVTVGVGAILAAVWGSRCGRLLLVRRTLVLIALAGLAALWYRPTIAVFTLPKMPLKNQLGVVREKGVKGEAFMLFPDWFIAAGEFYPFGKNVTLIRPPRGAQYAIIDANKQGSAQAGPYKDEWDRLAEAVKDGKEEVPPALWLFVVGLGDKVRQEEIAPVLDTYQISQADRESLFKVSRGQTTTTFRLIPGKIDSASIVSGRGRDTMLELPQGVALLPRRGE